MTRLSLILILLFTQRTGLELSDSRLGELNLNLLNVQEINEQLKMAFPTYNVERGIGQQDGPDFTYYEVSSENENLFRIDLDGNDSTQIFEIWIISNNIKDSDGIGIGSSLEELKKSKSNLRFHADVHYNIYASTGSSKLLYRLTGSFKMLNDSTMVAPDYSVKEWQLGDNSVEHLIWRK